MKLPATAMLILLFVLHGMAQTSQVVVTTTSMEPGLHIGDVLIVDGYYSGKNVQRFDIVVFKHPEADFKTVARVIALGGETIVIKNNRVFINSKSIKEPFKTRPCADEQKDNFLECANFGPLRVPKGEFFLLADNRAESLDSRLYDPHTIKQSQLIGKVTRVSRKGTGRPQTDVTANVSFGPLSRNLQARARGNPACFPK